MHTSSGIKGIGHLSPSDTCEDDIRASDLPVPILRYDATGRRRGMNAAAVAMMRAAAGGTVEPSGEAALLSAETLAHYLAAIRDVAATGVPREIELAFGTPSVGQGRHYAVQLAPQTASDGEAGVVAVCFDITARKQAEARLREREVFLESLLDTIPVPVFSKNREGRYLHLNQAFEDFFGAKKEQLIGKTVFDVSEHDLATIYFAMDEALFQAGGIQRYESKVRSVLKQEREVEFSKAVFYDGQGAPAGLIGAILDITERKQAERAQKKALDFAEGVVAAISDLLFEVDREGRYLNIWAKHPELLAASKESLLGRTVEEVLPPQQAATAMQAIGQADREGVAYGHMIVLDLPDGSHRWFEHSMAKKPGDTPAADTFLVLSRDVTPRWHAEQARDTAHARLKSVLQTIPDMVWLKDADHAYLSCNHAFERLVGKRESDIIGKTDYELFDTDTARFFQERDAAAIQARRICINEEWVTYADTGARALLETRKVPVLDAQGNVTGVLGVAQDITERKHFEEQIARREREFRTLVEHSPDVIMRYGPDFRRLYVNPSFATLIEDDIASLLGKTPTENPGGPHCVLFEQRLAEAFQSGRPIEFEMPWQDKDGKPLRYLAKLAPEFGADGTVESVLATGRDITELHASREAVHRMAFYDPLTSLPNRALFNEHLRQAIACTTAAQRRMAGVMMIDMDRFKVVNDTLGHAVGDELLREAAERLRACVRAGDTVARFGGDEFAILLPDVPTRCVLDEIARAILHRFDERFVLSGKEVFVSCSIGIAQYPTDSVEADDLMQYADSAMYLAKRSGRRGFRFYSKALTADATARLLLESELRRAVERGELELHYQPKVLCASHEVVGSEALLRWKRPGVGFVPPNQFIPVAEESGLIADLGRWVLREACRSVAAWNAHGGMPHKVAVNLSARQFQFCDLASMVSEILVETGCRPEWLELEITESLLLEEDEAVLGVLSAFKSMGISIAIDDFGTGYSALGYLARFPIDTLKIDRSFVQKMMADQRHAELVKAILSIAHCLGLQVVAEGVETAEQAAFLKENGCKVAQGFLYSKPLPKPDMAALPRYLQLDTSCSSPQDTA